MERKLPEYRIDMTEEEKTAVFLERDRIVAEESYEKYPHCEPKYCYRCGALLVATGISYYEGFHIDSCE